jgi:phosphoserine phosphatase RsbU/P
VDKQPAGGADNVSPLGAAVRTTNVEAGPVAGAGAGGPNAQPDPMTGTATATAVAVCSADGELPGSGSGAFLPAESAGAERTDPAPPGAAAPVADGEACRRPDRPTEQELLATLFDLGRQVTSVLDLDELLQKIPKLIARLTDYRAFAVYLIDQKRGDLKMAYSVGYPDDLSRAWRLKIGEGLIGAAAAEGVPVIVNDVNADQRYVRVVDWAQSELVVPLRRKKRTIGALNLLSDKRDCFTATDMAMLRQFGAHVAVAIENARLFEREREYAETLETLAEIGREVASILDLDQLLRRIALLVKRLIDYRTFGIMLLNEETSELEMKLAVKYGEQSSLPRVKLGYGLVGYAALHRQPVLVPDVAADPRYIKLVEDVRSELVIPLLVKDRCIGVFDLESPDLEAFTKGHEEILTLLASQAAVAIENARLYETIRANEVRLEKEIRFAQRVQVALLPAGPPSHFKGIDIAARFAPARGLGGDLYDFLSVDAHSLAVAVGDVSGKGVPAALYGAFAGELVRSRTFQRRFRPERSTPSAILSSINTILHERQLEEYYCTLCYALFDLRERRVVIANSGLPYPIRCSKDGCVQVEVSGVPLGSFTGSEYDEISHRLDRGDLFVFCSDGVFEAMDASEHEFGAVRLIETVGRLRDLPAQEIVEGIFDAVSRFRGDTPPNDDMTAVAVKITNG